MRLGLTLPMLLRHAIALPQMDRLFLGRDLDDFMAALFARAVVVDAEPPGAFPLRTIAQKATLQNVDLLRAILRKQVEDRLAAALPPRLSGPEAGLAEVMAVFEAPLLTGRSRTDLRKRLHVNCSTVSLLVGKGMIDSTRVRDPRTRQSMSLIAPEAVDRFLSIYVPLGLMAEALGTQAKHVSARLDKAEVRPIPLPDRCSLIYLRSEAAPVIAI